MPPRLSPVLGNYHYVELDWLTEGEATSRLIKGGSSRISWSSLRSFWHMTSTKMMSGVVGDGATYGGVSSYPSEEPSSFQSLRSNQDD